MLVCVLMFLGPKHYWSAADRQSGGGGGGNTKRTHSSIVGTKESGRQEIRRSRSQSTKN